MNTNARCRIDMIDNPQPENKVLRRREIPGGLRYSFARRKLPKWIMQKLRQGCALFDNDASLLYPGRSISVLEPNRH